MTTDIDCSLVIRTYNESRHLGDLLERVSQQATSLRTEVIVVDSGSTDATILLARKFGCHVSHISKDEFTFGRSLNMGCTAATGETLVFVSGHCVPTSDTWLSRLVDPILRGIADYTYGRQVGGAASRFSEKQLLRKYYPEAGEPAPSGFFCNNANAALRRSTWERLRFDETLTGLEDLELAKRLVSDGGRVAYVADAAVYHYHDETWRNVRMRYEREAIALQRIMPEVHLSVTDVLRYFLSAVLLDSGAALQERSLLKNAGPILLFRLMQFWGSYKGNHEHRRLSHAMKERYFYPK